MIGKLNQADKNMARKPRPEDNFDAGNFYASDEGTTHREKNAIRTIQRRITARALELLAVEPPTLMLDAGCGSGFSSELAKEVGFKVNGFDLDRKMVEAARKKGIDAKIGNLTKIPFEDSSFDCAISISALQWLGAGKSEKEAAAEYLKCAKEFHRVMRKGARAVIQFYPKDEDEAVLTGKAFVKAGFAARLQIDSSDNPRKRKVFLVLSRQ